MTIKELKDKIATLPDDMILIIQEDSEGNRYSPLKDIDTDCVYLPRTLYSGTVYSTDWSADDACLSQEEWDAILAAPRCGVLFPIN